MKKNRLATLALSGLMLCMSALPMGALTANATTVTINPSTTADDTAEVTSVTVYQLLTLEESEEDGYIVKDLGSAFGNENVFSSFSTLTRSLYSLTYELGWSYGDSEVEYPSALDDGGYPLSSRCIFGISIYYADNCDENTFDSTVAAKYLAQDLELLCDYDLDVLPYRLQFVFDSLRGNTVYTSSNSGAITINDLGYYLIVTEETDSVSRSVTSSYEILSVLGDEDETTIDIKTSYPTVDKLVSDDDTYTEETASPVYGITTSDNFYETADHDIGETYMYALQATLYGDTGYSYYDHYQVTFHDYYTSGVDFGDILGVSVTVLDDNGVVSTTSLNDVSADGFSSANGYYLVLDEGNNTFNLKVYDLVSIVDGMSEEEEYWGNPDYDIVVEVIYSATLNENANIATTSSDCANNSSGNANDNTVCLTYSNNPTACKDGYISLYNNNTYNSDGTPIGTGTIASNGSYVMDSQGNATYKGGSSSYEGKTIEDTVYVTTYELTVIKTDSNGELLAGAKFILSYTDEEGTIHYATAVMDHTFCREDLDDGDYEDTIIEYQGYYTITGYTDNIDEATEFMVFDDEDNDNGVAYAIYIKGLDSGTYTLTEVTAPDGYELPTGDDAETPIEISATHNETEEGTGSDLVLSGTTIDSDSLDDDGTYTYSGITLNGASVAIVNNKNSTVTLPTTGGMGTVLFYTVGGVLFVGGALLLITKRRVEEFE